MKKWAFSAGAFFLFLAVLLGAFGAHGLEKMLTPEKLKTFETGVRYQFYHALALLALGAYDFSAKIKLPLSLFIGGIILFSFNCYLYAVTGIKTFAMIVPIGGTLFLVAWLMIFFKGRKELA